MIKNFVDWCFEMNSFMELSNGDTLLLIGCLITGILMCTVFRKDFF